MAAQLADERSLEAEEANWELVRVLEPPLRFLRTTWRSLKAHKRIRTVMDGWVDDDV